MTTEIPELRAYAVFAGDPFDGAVLVFAHTAREARRLGYEATRGWFDVEWIDVRVRWIRRGAAVHAIPAETKPYVVESPAACEVCCCWRPDELPGEDGRCSECRGDAT